MVMSAPPPPPPPPMMYEPTVYEPTVVMDDYSDSEEKSSTHSTDLLYDEINDHRYDEERLTEAEKNERVQKQLMVSGPLWWCWWWWWWLDWVAPPILPEI